jgi:hypothetical protein
MRRLGRIGLGALVAVGAAAVAAHAVAALRTGLVAKSFSISGHVVGLTPGAHAALPLRIRNPWPWRIRVKSVAVYVEPSGHPCPVQSLQIRGFTGSLAVRPRSTRVLVLPVGLAATAPTDCQGATFALTFRGKAVRG